MSPLTALLVVIVTLNQVCCNQLRLHTDQEEQELYKISACVAKCLARGVELKEKCYERCSEPGVLDGVTFEYPDKSFRVELVCRDSTTLMVDVRQQFDGNATNVVYIYVIKVKEVDALLNSGLIVYVSNSSVVRIENLFPNKPFIVSATILSSSGELMTAQEHTLETLPLDYQPGEITEISVVSYSANSDNLSLLDAIIAWEPSSDRSCHYEVLCYANESPDYQLQQVYVDQTSSLYRHTIESLQLNEEYEIAVRATNPRHPTFQSELHWTSFSTPNCLDWYNSGDFCDPEAVQNIRVIANRLPEDRYQFNISWDQPRFLPDFYIVKLFDLDLGANDETANSVEQNVRGTQSHLLIESFELSGPQYEVMITAHANNRSSPAQSIIRALNAGPVAALADWSGHWILAIVISAIFSLCSVSLVICRKMRNKGTFHDQDSEYGIKLEPVKQQQEAVIPLPAFDDAMEIEFERVQLLEVLGEGAFGLVRKGTLNGTDVAVKMLKEHPSVQNIQEFQQEIDVMKSVGSHPNVVGIVGHFTARPNEMMLLTEYCSEGNLLNYLRNEWQKIMKQKEINALPEYLDCKTPGLAEIKRPESVFNFDTSFVNEKRSQEYKNICTEPVENKLYSLINEDVNNNSTNQNAVDNQCYQQLTPPISSSELLDFASQIATGMDFLARNKVVHRDLAARNVLIGAGRVVKISDFGLSRDVYQDNQYRKRGAGKLPIKWLALESLTHQMYTTQSDVWSFGILLYEICTLGGNPYPHLAASSLIAELRRGYRMEKPAGCGDELYELMRSCWSAMPVERPNFGAIRERLEKLLASSCMREQIDLDAIGEDMVQNVASCEQGYLKPVG